MNDIVYDYNCSFFEGMSIKNRQFILGFITNLIGEHKVDRHLAFSLPYGNCYRIDLSGNKYIIFNQVLKDCKIVVLSIIYRIGFNKCIIISGKRMGNNYYFLVQGKDSRIGKVAIIDGEIVFGEQRTISRY